MDADKTNNGIAKPGGKTRSQVAREYVESILIAVALAMVLRTFVIQAFKIPSASMEPTLLIGDHILVNKFIYGTKIPFSDTRLFQFAKPQRGDIVVFVTPEDKEESFWDQRDFIKRVVGIEGDFLEIKDKKVYINGKSWEDSFAVHRDPGIRKQRDNFGPITVPKDSLFVMGDNRDHSNDSRFWGFVNMKEVKGKAFIIYWSWNSLKKLPRWGRLFHLVH